MGHPSNYFSPQRRKECNDFHHRGHREHKGITSQDFLLPTLRFAKDGAPESVPVKEKADPAFALLRLAQEDNSLG